MAAFIESLESRCLLSAALPAAAVDTAWLEQRARRIEATQGQVSTFREQLRALLQGNRQQLTTLLQGGRATLRADLAALRAAKDSGDEAALDAAKDVLRTHRAEFREDVKALRTQFRTDLAALRDQLKASQRSLKVDVGDLRDQIKLVPSDQQGRLAGLTDALKGIKLGAVTREDVQSLVGEVRDVIAKLTLPSEASIDAARQDLRDALADGKVSADEWSSLKDIGQDLLEEAGLTQSDIDRLREQAESIWDKLFG